MSRPRLRTIRKQQGLTLQDMVDKIAMKGCDVPFLSRFERSKDTTDGITPELASAISAAYGVRLRTSSAKVVVQ
jgi:transcriptional regulator with XRE-family HTH domain